MLLRRPAHDLAAAHGVAEVGGVDLDMQQVAQAVHDDVPLVPLHELAAVKAPLVAGVLGLDALRVDDGVAGSARPMLFF